eukprot:3889970-Prymnesium_polylepis.1
MNPQARRQTAQHGTSRLHAARTLSRRQHRWAWAAASSLGPPTSNIFRPSPLPAVFDARTDAAWPWVAGGPRRGAQAAPVPRCRDAALVPLYHWHARRRRGGSARVCRG